MVTIWSVQETLTISDLRQWCFLLLLLSAVLIPSCAAADSAACIKKGACIWHCEQDGVKIDLTYLGKRSVVIYIILALLI